MDGVTVTMPILFLNPRHLIPVLKPALPDSLVAMVWTDARMKGTEGLLNVQKIPTDCLNFKAPFVNSISSIETFTGFDCRFFM